MQKNSFSTPLVKLVSSSVDAKQALFGLPFVVSVVLLLATLCSSFCRWCWTVFFYGDDDDDERKRKRRNDFETRIG